MSAYNEIVAYTDGSFRKTGTDRNGKMIGKCGYGIHFPNKEFSDVAKPYKDENQTNNRAELYAIYKTLRIINKKTGIKNVDNIKIYSDSDYSVKSLTVWIDGWKKRNWKNAKKKPVKNVDIIKKIDKYLTKYPDKIDLIWVKAHANNVFNDEADRLANIGADNDI